MDYGLIPHSGPFGRRCAAFPAGRFLVFGKTRHSDEVWCTTCRGLVFLHQNTFLDSFKKHVHWKHLFCFFCRARETYQTKVFLISVGDLGILAYVRRPRLGPRDSSRLPLLRMVVASPQQVPGSCVWVVT